MIKINNYPLEVGHFPDHTQSITFPHLYCAECCTITWLYECDEELFTLMCCVDYIRRLCPWSRVELYMPYAPNSRMDRVKDKTDNFSLKVFANAINAMDFCKVTVKNIHSNVSMALFKNIVDNGIDDDLSRVLIELKLAEWNYQRPLSINAEPYNVILSLNQEKFKDFMLFFPDEGACKRYSECKIVKDLGFDISFGIKQREWKTGKIVGYDVVGDVRGKNILIVDDICSAGGTFYFAGKKLKELGANDICLYVTHCEDNILNGKLLGEDSPISKIYTTRTIISENTIENNKDKIKIVG